MTPSYILHALMTAFRVARFGNNAVDDFDQSVDGFFRSFFGIVLAAPLYFIAMMAQHRIAEELSSELAEGGAGSLPQAADGFYLIEWGAYVVNWIALPVVMILITRLIGLAPRYVPFIVAYNWGSCFVLALSAIPYFFYLLGVIPLIGVALLYYPVVIFALMYHWRIARDGLQIPGLTAAGIVLLDLLLSILIALMVARLGMAL